MASQVRLGAYIGISYFLENTPAPLM